MAARAVELQAGDGVTLRGVRWGGGDGGWLVLVHAAGADLDCWWPLEPLLAEGRLSAVALDRRGHGGSEGSPDPEADRRDVRAAVRFARDAGADCVTVIAVGDAALTALGAAGDAARIVPLPAGDTAPTSRLPAGDDRPDALALLSPAGPDPLVLDGLRAPGLPKLLFAGAADSAADRAAATLSRASIGWSLVVGFPTAEQGADLLAGDWAMHVREHLARFTAETRAVVLAATTRATA